MIRHTTPLLFWMLCALLSAGLPAGAHDINQSGIRILYRRHDVVVTVTTALSRLKTAESGDATVNTSTTLDNAIRRRLQLRCEGQAQIWPKANIIVDRVGDLLCWQTVIAGPTHAMQVLGPLYPEDPASHTALTLLRDGQAVEESVLNAPAPMSQPQPNVMSLPGNLKETFTKSIATRHLTPLLALTAFGLAFLFGALHALSPGHGKTMVAAALVGTRGTAWHAILLGAVVTLTHTIGVFVLGLLTLSAAQTIVPERLYPTLSALSGGMIVCVGFTMLIRHLRKWRGEGSLEERFEAEEESEGDATPPTSTDGEITFRSLLVLGVTGGALPCPSALVVMLSAIALHRIAFGLILILAFSLGLSVVLTGIGLLVVRLGAGVERLPWNPRLIARLPLLGASTILITGVLFMVRAFCGSGF